MEYTSEQIEEFMREALSEANFAAQIGEVPIGAVVVCDGVIIARAHNMRNIDSDPTAHAEVLALRAAGSILQRWNLTGCDLFVTLEPCLMCSGAIVYSRIRRVYFGASDLRFGCCGTLANYAADMRFNHRAQVFGGILAAECLAPISKFFCSRR